MWRPVDAQVIVRRGSRPRRSRRRRPCPSDARGPSHRARRPPPRAPALWPPCPAALRRPHRDPPHPETGPNAAPLAEAHGAARRRLTLLGGGRVLAVCRVSLGFAPIGPKATEGGGTRRQNTRGSRPHRGQEPEQHRPPRGGSPIRTQPTAPRHLRPARRPAETSWSTASGTASPGSDVRLVW